MNPVSPVRLQELLATRATQGLDTAESAELERILRAHPEWDDEGFEIAAAALDLALQRSLAALPRALQERLEARARAWKHPAPGQE